ncbi:MAG: RluA family pseudouridine synthase [Pseudomonadota bacterium]|nr:RluA family pseudouridine synthase [Pseudomonadota bacterium]
MKNFDFTIPESLDSKRLDVAIAALCPDLSRSKIQKLIAQSLVSLNGQVVASKRTTVNTDDSISFQAAEEKPLAAIPQSMPLDIAYEDSSLMVINKPSGLVVHPGAGNPDQTLLNAIIAKCPDNTHLPQAGLIHRLDKDTTGLLIIAKNEASYFKLNQAMAKRHIKRTYLALVKGKIHKGGTIDAAIARHSKFRQKYCVHPTGRNAVTHYQVEERFPHHTLLRISLETGRTHQIRVHMLHLNHPIVGDTLYHRGQHIKQSTLSEKAKATLYAFKRQALHAVELTFDHPEQEKQVNVKSTIPSDFDHLLKALRTSAEDPA